MNQNNQTRRQFEGYWRSPIKAAAVLSLLFIAYRPAVAGTINLVVNPGFESGDFTGWNLLQGGNGTFVSSVTHGYDSHTGTYDAVFLTIGSEGIIAQTLIDTVGMNYTFSFWLKTFGDQGSDFSVYFNGANLLSEVDPPEIPYTEYTYNVVGTGRDTISFSGQDEPGYILLDDVSLIAVDSSAPEPSTLMLTGLGCVGLLAGSRRIRLFPDRN